MCSVYYCAVGVTLVDDQSLGDIGQVNIDRVWVRVEIEYG